MPLIKTAAITLKSRKWGDADRIVTFYTKEIGKVRAVARGARRMKSRLGASLEPLTICHLNLFEKSGDSLYRVSQVDLVEPFMRFREDLTLMTAAARMVNVVGAVTPDGDPDPQLFETLELGLRALVTSQDPALTALLFQIRLLGLIGFRPQTDHCAACGKGRLMGEPQFSPLSGGLVCMVCAARQGVPLFAALAREPGISAAGIEAFARCDRSFEGRRSSSARGGKCDRRICHCCRRQTTASCEFSVVSVMRMSMRICQVREECTEYSGCQK